MSKAMTEQEVRDKFGAYFDTAYEYIEGGNNTHDLVMHVLQAFAEDIEDFKEFMVEIKEFAQPPDDEGSRNDAEKLVDMILEEFGELHPDELDKLVGTVAKRFLDDPPRRKCDHPQLYAHAVVNIVLPVAHNSAVEMTRLYDLISAVLEGTAMANYILRAGIEVDEDGTV